MFCWFIGAAQHNLEGIVILEGGEPACFATIAFTNLNSGKLKGTTANGNGVFSAELPAGKYAVKVHLIGYSDADTTIEVLASKQNWLRLVLVAKPSELGAVQVFADRRGIAREVVGKAINARSRHFKGDGNTTSYQAYTRTSVQCLEPDTAKVKDDSTKVKIKPRDRALIRTQYHLSELQSQAYWSSPSDFSEKIIGANEFTKSKPYTSSAGASVSFDYGEPDILPQQWSYDDNYVLKSLKGFHEFSIYQRLLHIPSLCDKKILSPIGEGALVSYQYDLDSVVDSLGVKYYKVQFKGVFPGEPLLKGTMTIRSSDWAVTSTSYGMPKDEMKFFSDLRVQFNYSIDEAEQAKWDTISLQYVVEDGLSTYHGVIERITSEWMLAQPGHVFTEEVRMYDALAFDR
ncbi:MAG: DUF5686 family protein, partial [Flavobacteriales bacterium]